MTNLKNSMIVGVLNYRFDYYPYTRNIINRVPGANYQPVQDLYSNLNRAARKINRIIGKDIFQTFNLNNQFQDFGLNKVDILHFFNGVSYGKTPWVTQFETLVPRLSDIVTRNHEEEIQETILNLRAQRAFDALSSQHCKKIIALSDCTYNMELDLLSELSTVDVDSIKNKMIILHPPQETIIDSYESKALSLDGKLRFMIVASGFIHKGGREILRVFEKLVNEEGYPIELTIISSLRMHHYAAHETQADVDWVKERITANSDWITFYPQLPNEEVLALMKQTHVGLMPTYADTYGYSVLEFQAAGVPMITTNVRALPEINPEEAGWLIEVPRNHLREALYNTPEEREQLRIAIESGLEAHVRAIFEDRESIHRKGAAALLRIQQNHSPIEYGKTMGKIYRESII